MADPRYLLDSNICIYLLEGLSPEARSRLEACRRGEAVTSAIAYAEVMRGLEPDDRRASMLTNRFFALIEVLPFDGPAALRYRQIPFRRGQFDRLIAAHALALGLTIVTANERDFADIPDVHVENWTLPL